MQVPDELVKEIIADALVGTHGFGGSLEKARMDIANRIGKWLDAALAAGDGAGQFPETVGDKIVIAQGEQRWLVQALSRLDDVPHDAPADTLGPPNWAERAEPEATQPGERDRLREALERAIEQGITDARALRGEAAPVLNAAHKLKVNILSRVEAALSASAPGVQGQQFDIEQVWEILDDSTAKDTSLPTDITGGTCDVRRLTNNLNAALASGAKREEPASSGLREIVANWTHRCHCTDGIHSEHPCKTCERCQIENWLAAAREEPAVAASGSGDSQANPPTIMECGCELHGEMIRPCARHLEFFRKTLSASPAPQQQGEKER